MTPRPPEPVSDLPFTCDGSSDCTATTHILGCFASPPEPMSEAMLVLVGLLKVAGEDDERCHEYLDILGAAKYDGDERLAPYERLMSLAAKPYLLFYCHAGIPRCFCAFRRVGHMHREAEHRHYASLNGWFARRALAPEAES